MTHGPVAAPRSRRTQLGCSFSFQQPTTMVQASALLLALLQMTGGCRAHPLTMGELRGILSTGKGARKAEQGERSSRVTLSSRGARIHRSLEAAREIPSRKLQTVDLPGLYPIDMDYHGGPIMWKPVNLYIIWLGSNFTQQQKALVRTFIASLNPQSKQQSIVAHARSRTFVPGQPIRTVAGWWDINNMYVDSLGRQPAHVLTIKGEVSVPRVPEMRYNRTMRAFVLHGETSVIQIITRVLDRRLFPVDEDAVYTVISDNTIFQMGVNGNPGARMCQRYCGWHDSAKYVQVPSPNAALNGGVADIKYVWVGTGTTLCPRSCIPMVMSGGQYASPALDMGIQGTISILAHELAEAVVDPDGSAWWSNADGDEHADKCQWNYNATQTFQLPDGRSAVYNLVGIDGTKFLVQGNWDFRTGQCTIQG